MELQAIRYASMISAMTFERAVQIHGEFLARMGESSEEARARMLAFLNWDEPDEENFAPDIRIILVSEDFGKELTTAVLWLRDRDIDIRCVRLRPYQDGDTCLVDVQQIIPLPEAHEYQVQLREKEQVGRKKRAERYDVRLKFWEGLVALARRLRKTNASSINFMLVKTRSKRSSVARFHGNASTQRGPVESSTRSNKEATAVPSNNGRRFKQRWSIP
jgi:hypothetical protein